MQSGVKEAIVRGALAADARAKEMGDELGRWARLSPVAFAGYVYRLVPAAMR